MLTTNKNYKQRDFEAWFAANVPLIHHFIVIFFFKFSNPAGLIIIVVCHGRDFWALLPQLHNITNSIIMNTYF